MSSVGAWVQQGSGGYTESLRRLDHWDLATWGREEIQLRLLAWACRHIAQMERWPGRLYPGPPFPLCASVSPVVKGLGKVAFPVLPQFCHMTLAQEKGDRAHSVVSWGLVWGYQIWPCLLWLVASAWHAAV